MWKILTVFCVVAFATAAGDDLSEGELGTYMKQTNDIFDQILDSVSRSEELDPFQLPEMVSSFERKILFRFHGESRIYNGTVTGLSTMHRAGDSHLRMDESKLEVLADVGVGALDVNCKAHVKFMGRGPTVNIAVHIAYARILLEAFQPQDGEMTLKQFKLQELDGFKLKMTGLGPLTYLFTYFVRVFTKLFKNKVKNIVESKLAKMVANKLKGIKLGV
uniref:Putative secreted protein n=1 Tax=Ixodes ricinus TaxID=34613 RepID=A0A131XV06_IXORI